MIAACLCASSVIGGDEDVCIDFVLSNLIDIGDEHVSGPVVFGDFAYVKEQNVGIHLFDIGGDSITPLGMALKGDFSWIRGNSSHLFAHADKEIMIYSIEDPLHPVLEGSVEPGMYGSVKLINNELLVLMNWQEGTMLIDVSDPATPTVESFIPVGPSDSEFHNDMVVAGRYGFLAAEHEGVRVFDLSDLSNPIDLGHAIKPNFFSFFVELSLHNGNLHATYETIAPISFTWILDIKEPTNPIILANYFGVLGHRGTYFGESVGIWNYSGDIHYGALDSIGSPLAARQEFQVDAGGLWFDEPNNRVLITSNAFHLTINDFDIGWLYFDDECPGVCWADLNGDGESNYFDVALFMPAYINGERAGDINNDGSIRFTDVYEMIDMLATGCP